MTTTNPGSTAVDILAERFFEGVLERHPLWATVLGDERWDDRWDDPSEAGRAREIAALDEVERDIAAVEAADLPAEDRITIGILRVIAETRREAERLRLWEMDSLDQMNGPQTLPTELARFQRIDTPERLERLLARLEAYPALLEAHAENLAAGIRSGRTAARVPVERTIAQTRAMVEAPIEASPLLSAHPELAAGDRERLTARRRALGPAGARLVPRVARGVPAACPRRRRPVLAARRRGGVPLLDPRLHDAARDRAGTPRPRPGADRGAERASATRSRASWAIPTRRRTARSSRPIPRTSRAIRPRSCAWRRAGSPAPSMPHPRGSGCCRAPRARSSRSSLTRRRTPRPRSTSRPARTARARAATTSTPTSRSTGRSIGSPRPPSTRRRPATTSRSRWRRSCRASTASAGSARASRAWPTPRAGGCTPRASPTRWACTPTTRERFGRFDSEAWRAVRLVVDTGMHAFRWTRQQSIDLLREARRPLAGRGRDRDRPLHHLARPGARLHDRPARDPRPARAARAARWRPVRPAGVPRRRSSATARCPSRRSARSCRGGCARPRGEPGSAGRHRRRWRRRHPRRDPPRRPRRRRDRPWSSPGSGWGRGSPTARRRRRTC